MEYLNQLAFVNNFHLLAEIGVNHEGSIDTAKELISLARNSGCHSVKLQAYKAESLVTNMAEAYWDLSKEGTTKQIELFRRYDHFNFAEYEELSIFTHSLEMQFGLSIFDPDWIEPLSECVDYFKIASADITCIPLLEEISKFQKPIILSTGAATISEIYTATRYLNSNGNNDISLLHCILNYPTLWSDSNLSFISRLRTEFPNYRIGVSDHIAEPKVDRFMLARTLGASIIEKHFTNDKNLPGNDHYHSGNSIDFKNILDAIMRADTLMGTGEEYLECEIPARVEARRSIVYSIDLPKGKKIEKHHLKYKRPGNGLAPSRYPGLIGQVLSHEVIADAQVIMSDFE